MLAYRGQRKRDIPFDFVYNICREGNTPGYRFIEQSMLRNREEGLERTERFVREKAPDATKLTTYVTEMNPNLRIHPMYATKKFISDYPRKALTRLRFMSHNPMIEVGRWSRTPADHRVCQCDGVQV